VWASVRASVGASMYGQHAAGWLAFYDYFRGVLGLTTQTDKLAGLIAQAKQANWFLPHKNICWVSERHHVLKCNEEGQLHCETGPSVMYPDGWAIYAFNGVRIPEKWIEEKKSLTPEIALTWENIEQRRAACEILGWSLILDRLNARTINKHPDPQIGELVEVDLPDSGRERFLRVKCGTGRIFAIPVPPDMDTAHNANAWSYGLDASELKPEVRT